MKKTGTMADPNGDLAPVAEDVIPAPAVLAPPPPYIAVKHGRSASCAIFLNWEDAAPHIDGYPEAEFQQFASIQDAASYLITGNAPASATATSAATATVDDVATAGGLEFSSRKRMRQQRGTSSKSTDAAAASCAREPSEKWKGMLERLRTYKNERGSASVDPKDKENEDLRLWLHGQKSNLRKHIRNAKEMGQVVNNKKVKELEQLGVDLSEDAKYSSSPSEWQAKYEALRQYKEANNDCLVPTDPKGPHRALALWVFRQQKQYKRLREGKRSQLNADLVVKLNDLGFAWTRREPFVSWEERLEHLRQFKAEHGHCKVSTRHPELGPFVSRMRREYREYTEEEGKRKLNGSTIDPENFEKRINDLKELGFVFSAGKRIIIPPKHMQKTWDERFAELLQYKTAHGHTIVPQSYPGLGEWVHRQRKDYKALRDGKPSKMTAERALKLNEEGFVFDATRNRGRDSRIISNSVVVTGAMAAAAAAATAPGHATTADTVAMVRMGVGHIPGGMSPYV